MPLRIKAFLLHFSCSVLIALLALLLVFKLWYPAPLHEALGVTHIFLLLLMVDVLLGPLLTLVVFKAGKPSLKFDLTVIFLLQISALSYGLWTVAAGRPAWLVFNVDRFDVIQAVDVDIRGLDQADERYRTASWVGPEWVGAIRPPDQKQRETIMFEAVTWGMDVAQRPEFYRSLVQVADDISARAQPLSNLNKFNDAALVNKTLTTWPTATSWVPLKARVKPMVVLLGKNRNEVLAIVDLKPWE